MTILIERNNNGVAHIRLNRPDVHNAFNEQMISDLTVAFADIEKCPDTRVVILSGNGKSFSAGADLEWMRKAAEYTYEENVIDAQKLSYMLKSLYKLKQLTIASLHGSIMGGGLGLAACSDIVIADKSSRFAFSEVKLGLIPATISPFVLDAIGPRHAKRYFQTGEIFDSERALQMGLISEIVDDDQDRSRLVGEILKQVEMNAPGAMSDAKQLAHDFAYRAIDDELRLHSAQRIAKARTMDEAKEGISAFLEKRKPGWVNDV